MINNQFVLTDSIKAIDSEMASLQAKIDKLEAQKSALYQAEKVCIEAMQAINNAVAVLNEVDPGQVPIFGEFIAAKFTEFTPRVEEPEIVEPEAPVEVEAPQTEPEAQPEPEAQTEPEAQPEPEAPIKVETPEAQPEPKTQTATIKELKTLSIQAIRKLAAKKNAGGSGTRAEIASRLAGLVTTAELKALS